MLREGKNNISRNVARSLVRKVNRWVYLEIVVRRPGSTEGKEVLLPALKVDLETVLLGKVISISKHSFDTVTNRLDPDNELMLFGVIPSL
jgi:hypothetical protein